MPLAAAAPAGPVHPAWAAPFILLLACVALAPLVNRHWWERYYPAVAVGLGAVAAGYYLLVRRDAGPWLHGMQDYVSFVILLGALYVVSGGIVIGVNRRATPAANCALLLIGALAANVFGTTGASMLLIRPYLRMNRGRVAPYHVVFFIFVVANVGGSLTPIGDPPLFLGYLHGVPFWWVLENAQKAWLLAVGVLIGLFFVIDSRQHGRHERHSPIGRGTDPRDLGPAVSLVGAHNFLFISLILFAVFRDGFFEHLRQARLDGMSLPLLGRMAISREPLMLLAAAGSLLLTRRPVYQANEFSWGPVREVAVLFLGIFSTMVPALQWLGQNAERLPLRTAGQYYFTTGSLSSVLDNAPTYLTFLQVQLGKLDETSVEAATGEVKQMHAAGSLEPSADLPPDARAAVDTLIRTRPADVLAGRVARQDVRIAFLLASPPLSRVLLAISLGSVFFGACTYIGNGPNFMVKSIAEGAGVPMPGFLGYVFHYTVPFLLPLYGLVWVLFFAPALAGPR